MPNDDRLDRNARIVLTHACRAKSGESLLILVDEVMRPWAEGLSRAATALGLVPVVMDVRKYLASQAYAEGYVLESVRAAIASSDIVLENLPDTWVPNRPSYGRLTGEPDLEDQALSGERRWMILQCGGLDEWEVEAEEIAAVQERTDWLLDLVRSSREGHITGPSGTDFTFALGSAAHAVPVKGIIPLYGEVAVMPVPKGTRGVMVVDGPTQCEVRPSSELAREPLRIEVEDGRVSGMSGEARQLARLQAFVESGDPLAEVVDEVGIVTTHLVENDVHYWSDGTHHHDRVHIALGNNARRDAIVHGPKHMDCEVDRPTIWIDGEMLVRDGEWMGPSHRERKRGHTT